MSNTQAPTTFNEARQWATDHSIDALWRECSRGDWLLRILRDADIEPDRDWTARHIVAHAFDAAAATLDGAGVDHDLHPCAEAMRHDGAKAAHDAMLAAWDVSVRHDPGPVRPTNGYGLTEAVASRASRAAVSVAWQAATESGWLHSAGKPGVVDDGMLAELARIADAVRAIYPTAPDAVRAMFSEAA